jgi:hypothetical protein
VAGPARRSSLSSMSLSMSSSPSPSSPSPITADPASASAATMPTSLSTRDVRTLFRLLSDVTIFHDPSRGTCCRNGCSGCNYLDPTSGKFAYEVYRAVGSDADECDADDGEGDEGANAESAIGGWLAPYHEIVIDDMADDDGGDYGGNANAVISSSWGRILFHAEDTKATTSAANAANRGKEIEWDAFPPLILSAAAAAAAASAASGMIERGENNDDDDDGREDAVPPSPLAIESLWRVLSPSRGYARLASTEVSSSIRGMIGSEYSMGGAVDYKSFEACMYDAADRIVRSSGGGGVDEGGGASSTSSAMDYDSMDRDELLELCRSRNMNTSFPKMKRIIIEELRFYDANGRQGKRHPVKNTLS